MRIARFVIDDDPTFGFVTGEPGSEIVEAISGDPIYAKVVKTGKSYPLSDVRLVAPVIPRSKVVGIGRNYAAHAAEFGNDVPSSPLMFFKPNTSVIGPDDPIRLPTFDHQIDYEGELAVVIGKICKDVPVKRANDVIFGYTCGNDVSARSAQKSDGQWARAKGFDGSCPLGPWIVTPDEFDPSDVAIRTRLDGHVVQDARTDQMVFDIPTLIAYMTEAFTLLPGDVILTGTPAGVGRIRHGQRVDVEIEGIGTLTNPVIER